jgi:hypothetical protein
LNEKDWFSLWDLPSKLVYVSLNPDFSKEFFARLQEFYSIGILANKTEVKLATFQKWLRSVGKADTPFFIRLDSFRNLVEMLKLKTSWNLSEEVLEKNIQAIRGYRGSKILWNPHLPFKENRDLVRIVVHLIGDGYLPKSVGSARTPAYTNGNMFLREQFHQTFARVFGDVSNCTRSYIDKSEKGRSYVAFSKWLGYLIRHWYPDARFDELEGSLPSAFFELPFELKTEIVQTFGDDDGHVGAHSIRFVSGGATILEQMRQLIVELMEVTLPVDEFEGLLQSVGAVKPCQSWFIFDLFRPVFGWYAEHVGFTHPERVARLRFQLECDRVWGERGLDGFDLDFLTLVGLRAPGSVQEVAERFMLREDFLFKVFQGLRRWVWIRRVRKVKFTTVYQTTAEGETFLARVWSRQWGVADRVVMREGWWQNLRDQLLARFGTAAGVARAAGMPETTARGYLQGRREWMEGRWVVALARLVGMSEQEVSAGVWVAMPRRVAPRYEQCSFLEKELVWYERFSAGLVSFAEWLELRQREGGRSEQLLDAGFAVKLESAGVIRARILELARVGGGEVSLEHLKADSRLQELTADRYPAYLADRMAKLIQQGVFVRVRKGVYRLV